MRACVCFVGGRLGDLNWIESMILFHITLHFILNYFWQIMNLWSLLFTDRSVLFCCVFVVVVVVKSMFRCCFLFSRSGGCSSGFVGRLAKGQGGEQRKRLFNLRIYVIDVVYSSNLLCKPENNIFFFCFASFVRCYCFVCCLPHFVPISANAFECVQCFFFCLSDFVAYIKWD